MELVESWQQPCVRKLFPVEDRFENAIGTKKKTKEKKSTLPLTTSVISH